MRIRRRCLLFLVFSCLPCTSAFADKGRISWSPRILFAKTVYFDNETGSEAVGNSALVALNKWGRFQIVPDRKEADLLFLLSVDPYRGGTIIFSGGQTGTVDSRGRITEDSVPQYNKQSPARYVYLAVIDLNSGDTLWSGEHAWGGLLTGFNRAGKHLVLELENQIKKIGR
jgi:hypothetical protein